MKRGLIALALLALYLHSAPRFLGRPRHTHARCPACGYQGCDGSLSQCTERWR